MLRLFRERMRGQPGRGAGRDDLSIARRGRRRFSDRSKQSGTLVEGYPKKGRGTSVGFDFRVRPGGTKQKRGFGWRTEVEVAGLLFGGSCRWEATPELVSLNSGLVPLGLGFGVRRILRSAQWGLAAMPAPISFGACQNVAPALLSSFLPDLRSRDLFRIRALQATRRRQCRGRSGHEKESHSCLPLPRSCWPLLPPPLPPR